MSLLADLPKWLDNWLKDQPLWISIPAFLLILIALGAVVIWWKHWTAPRPPKPPAPPS